MATAQYSPSKPPLSTKRSQNLQEMLTEVGLSVDYWLPILKEHLGVTSAQALQHLEENDLQKLKSHTQHPWEKKALEKLLTLSHSLSDLQESQDRATQKKQKQAEQALQELKELQSERGQQMEEAMRKNPDLKRPLEITEEYRLPPQKPLREVMGEVQRSPPLIEGTISQRQNLPDKELLTWASGGLALQGIYKTHHQSELIEKREKLLSVPKDFSLSGPEQHTRMETMEFTSSQAESMFTQTMEKLGFSLTASIKGGGWGFSLEAETDYNKHSESKESKRSCSERSYFCLMKFQYIPMVSFHFSIDQLQFSKAALQELKYMEDLLDPNAGPHRFSSLMRRTEKFFHRFGSHANQGPLHLGGIYWWKAVSEGFQQEQLAEVRQQSAQALDSYIRGGYSGFGVKVAGGMNVSDSHSQTDTEMKMSQNLRINMQLSMGHRGGPPEADDLVQWKVGLIASNQTWCVIDRELQLVSIWDIILSSHRTDFKNPIQLAHYLEECYTDLSRPSTLTLHIKELLSAEKKARIFLEGVKHWKISDPEEQLKELLNFRQMLSQKIKRYDIWINMCLTDYNLQDFLVSMVIFCKKSSKYQTKFIKSQLCSLLDPHIYSVTSFPETHSIMQWIHQSEPE
ncbi:Interferon-induced very large GTPase 1 [Tupaia chinensis]|uniref:Interferon-induced very large GTPase 1 n=1 Tax=Tupaia chinensis TaxID=246437 RepID=L9KUN3_TUPCH|nr:Interferon-induced very large GTPase 1 [Tupaia chinensis]